MFRILCPCTMGMQYPKWPEEAVRFLGTVVTYVCELPCGCGNQTPVLWMINQCSEPPKQSSSPGGFGRVLKVHAVSQQKRVEHHCS